MQDRFTFGFYSGVIAGLVLNILNLISYYVLKIATLRYIDFMAIIVFGNKPMNAFDTILALLIHLGFVGVLGIIFVYLVPFIGSQNLVLKGLIFGLTTFLVTYSITALFGLRDLTIIPPYTVASNIVTSSVFGLVLVRLYKKFKIHQ